MLFSPDETSQGDNKDDFSKFDEDEAMKAAYETVNEGDTTDTTTSGLDGESLEQRAMGTSALKNKS